MVYSNTTIVHTPSPKSLISIWLGGDSNHNGSIEISVWPELKLEGGVVYEKLTLKQGRDRCFDLVATGDRCPIHLILSTRCTDGKTRGVKRCILGPVDEQGYEVLASASGVDDRGVDYEVRIIQVQVNRLAAFCVEFGDARKYICVRYGSIVITKDINAIILEGANVSVKYVEVVQAGFKEI